MSSNAARLLCEDEGHGSTLTALFIPISRQTQVDDDVLFASLAQSVERRPFKPVVAGSSPARGGLLGPAARGVASLLMWWHGVARRARCGGAACRRSRRRRRAARRVRFVTTAPCLRDSNHRGTVWLLRHYLQHRGTRAFCWARVIADFPAGG